MSTPGYDWHIGFFWGDTPGENKFWHSIGGAIGSNQITQIMPGSQPSIYYLYKLSSGYRKLPPKNAEASAHSSRTKFTAKWDKVTGASGYRVYMYSGGKWKALATVKKGDVLQTTIMKKLKKGKTYALRIRSYKNMSGEKNWSKPSGVFYLRVL